MLGRSRKRPFWSRSWVLVLFWSRYVQRGVSPPPQLIMNDYSSILDIIDFDFSVESMMSDEGRVITAKLPDDLVSRLDEVAGRIDRSKSWIVRQAITEWLSDEQRRYELTVEALKDVDEGRMISHDDLRTWGNERKREASTKSAA